MARSCARSVRPEFGRRDRVAAVVWKSPAPLALRFSALTLAAVLVNPHLYIYDLLALVPAFLLLADWALNPPAASLPRPRFARPVVPRIRAAAASARSSRWTHLQLSVPVFAALVMVYSVLQTSATRESRTCFRRIRALYNPSSHREPYANPKNCHASSLIAVDLCARRSGPKQAQTHAR